MRKPLARRLARVCLPLTLALAASFASVTVVPFDDLATDGFVPANYAGLDWSASSWFQYAGEQAPYTPHSGDRRATLEVASVSQLARVLGRIEQLKDVISVQRDLG